MKSKTLHNSSASTAKDNVSDLTLWGNPNVWELICKASSDEEGWMKSTKAIEILDVGVLVQVTTQQRNPDESSSVAEAVAFVPGVRVEEIYDDAGLMVSRRLVSI